MVGGAVVIINDEVMPKVKLDAKIWKVLQHGEQSGTEYNPVNPKFTVPPRQNEALHQSAGNKSYNLALPAE